MITHVAFIALQFSASVAALALLTWALGRRGSELRRAAGRIAVMFGVFAVAAGYIWLEVGPEVDYRLQVRDRPLLLHPAPHEVEA